MCTVPTLRLEAGDRVRDDELISSRSRLLRSVTSSWVMMPRVIFGLVTLLNSHSLAIEDDKSAHLGGNGCKGAVLAKHARDNSAPRHPSLACSLATLDS